MCPKGSAQVQPSRVHEPPLAALSPPAVVLPLAAPPSFSARCTASWNTSGGCAPAQGESVTRCCAWWLVLAAACCAPAVCCAQAAPPRNEAST